MRIPISKSQASLLLKRDGIAKEAAVKLEHAQENFTVARDIVVDMICSFVTEAGHDKFSLTSYQVETRDGISHLILPDIEEPAG